MMTARQPEATHRNFAGEIFKIGLRGFVFRWDKDSHEWVRSHQKIKSLKALKRRSRSGGSSSGEENDGQGCASTQGALA